MDFGTTASDGSTVSVTLLLVIDASSMIGSYTERFTVPATLNMLPFADTMALRAPHVSVEVVQDEWIEGLDPDGPATVIGTLQERLEHLEAMHGRLEVARAEWRAGR